MPDVWDRLSTKRQIKSPKYYFTEVGLAAYLLGIETPNQMSRDPLRGQLFENLLVSEARKVRLNQNLDPNLYFLRTEGGVEVDMILQREGKLYPFEIKSSMTPQKEYARHLQTFEKGENNATEPTILYAGESFDRYLGVRYQNYRESWRCFV